MTKSNEQYLLLCYKIVFLYICVSVQQEAYLPSHETMSTKLHLNERTVGG